MAQVKVSITLVIFFSILFFDTSFSQSFRPPDCSNYAPKNYDPVTAPEIATEVQVEDMIRSITKLDEVEGFMELQLYTKIQWKDERLFSDGFADRFKGSDNDMVELPPTSLQCIWTGFVHFDELLGGEMFNSDLNFPYVELIQSEKMVQVIARYRIQILCSFDFRNYPMDAQECTLTMKPRMRGNYYLVWAQVIQPLDPNNFNVSTFKLIQRRVATALIAIYFPSTLIVFISFVSFWVDSLAVPGRVTLVITSLLALMTQLVAVRDKATPVSYVTALDIWFFACLAFVSAALFEFALSYNFAVKRDSISLIHANPEAGESKAKKSTIVTWIRKLKRRINLRLIPAPGLDGTCRFLFPFLFILFATGYWIYFGLSENRRAEMAEIQ